MNGTLSDIRILKLAEMYERSYEDFVLDMAERYVHDVEIRRRLRTLVDPKDGHGERIAAVLLRLNARAQPVDKDSLERAALRDVLEVERSARSFYLRFVEEIHDPEVARLFRQLAREEAEHIRIAEDALAISDKKLGRVHIGADSERLRLVDDSSSWEGASDFGRTRLSKT